MSTEQPDDPLIGTQLGGYVIEALLGKGAMGRVYRAVQVSLNRPVALKVMAGHLVGSAESAARFWREARAAAAINHPNLVRVHDFGEAGGIYFYAMELVDGLSLGAYLRRGDRFTERECIEVGREVTLALRAAHRAGVIHRDLKPDNLMLNSEGVVKVADLGVARFLSEGAEEPDAGGDAAGETRDMRAWDSLTLTGVGMGTPAFMSPEQIRAEKGVDHRSDFYALGATLFQLATCRAPFPADTAAEVLEKQLSAPVPRARDVNPALGKVFSELIGRLMAKSPDERPQTHEDILEALEACLRAVRGGRSGASRVRGADAPSWGPMWVGGAALILAVLFVWGRGPFDDVSRFPIADGRSPMVGSATNGVKDAEGSRAMIAKDAKASPINSNPKPETPPASPAPLAARLASATKDLPFVNSLGMKFVPVPGTKVLFSVWETRVQDFGAFVKATDHDTGDRMQVLQADRWSERDGYTWREPGFEQGPDHPVVGVGWEDAVAFCAWLTREEQATGRIGVRDEYRLPSEQEWNAAVGTGTYPWGDGWPPPRGAGNYAGEESRTGGEPSYWTVLGGYRDGYGRTAPVGSFAANEHGLCDMGGNVWEWCKDRHGSGKHLRGLCGASWYDCDKLSLQSSYRSLALAGDRNDSRGFRCVLALSATPAASAAIDLNVLPESATVAAPSPQEGTKDGVGASAAVANPSRLTASAPTDFAYSTNGRVITIAAYKGRGGAVSIPDTIDGFPVKAIGTSAFDYNPRPTRVAIPSDVSKIGGGNFKTCPNLEAITVDPANANYCSVDGVLFDKAQTRLIAFPGGKAGEYSVPDAVTDIVKMAFAYNTRLTGVSIPAGVMRIGLYPFHGCTGLKTIRVDPSNANYCGVDDVLLDKGQTRIIQFPAGKTCANYAISARVAQIDAYAFLSCVGLSAITVDAANANYSSVGGVLFKKGETELFVFPAGKTGAYTVPTGVRTILGAAFAGSSGLTSVTIPNSVTRIEGNAFEGCIGLRGVIVPDSVTEMQGCTFQGCSGLTNATLPKGITRIDGQTFFLCRTLTSMTIPDGVTSIGYRAFFGCTGLLSMTIPERVTTIDSEAFRECENLAEIYFKGNAPRLGQDVFKKVKKATVYCLSGTTGWDKEFGGLPTAPWDPRAQTRAVGSADAKWRGGEPAEVGLVVPRPIDLARPLAR